MLMKDSCVVTYKNSKLQTPLNERKTTKTKTPFSFEAAIQNPCLIPLINSSTWQESNWLIYFFDELGKTRRKHRVVLRKLLMSLPEGV